ncbi:DNA-binding response OmpR family regulator [Kineosphaera limosa]|uniref:Putative response regulator n=1 Tax=Kineosphaera limosa NBRC 100340 TaxID=1184609 RepID=K6WXV8_9MICO|nr:response regulator transcription factor [Kineosphaera limosa]NYD99038.1 DNA-binding response OmpR family regulator [Kineosphaera limosa]GAB96927.1 putative response regulator [Kineosphaera limosa NBRC 100340]
MTAAEGAHEHTGESRSHQATHRVRVLVYSDDRTTREAVRMAVGRRPSRDVEVESWLECATADAVMLAAQSGDHDILVLDGEATPYGGLGLCRELKHSIYQCPPVIVLTARPQDAWLASWSYADHAVPQPLDPMAMADAIARVARRREAIGAGSDNSAH